MRLSPTDKGGTQRKLALLTIVFLRNSNENRRTLRCKTPSVRAGTENRGFGKKPQKTRPKKKRGKNLPKTTQAEDGFAERKTMIAFDTTLVAKTIGRMGIDMPTCRDDQTMPRYATM